jgi:hypothetical protein
MPRRELDVPPPWVLLLVGLSGLVAIGPFIWLPITSYRHSHRQEWSLTLNCWKKDHFGRFRAIQVFLCRDSRGDEFWRRCRCDDLGSTERIPSGTFGATAEVKEITIIQPSGVWWPVTAEPLPIRHWRQTRSLYRGSLLSNCFWRIILIGVLRLFRSKG